MIVWWASRKEEGKPNGSGIKYKSEMDRSQVDDSSFNLVVIFIVSGIGLL
jgi:hypothetical protein